MQHALSVYRDRAVVPGGSAELRLAGLPEKMDEGRFERAAGGFLRSQRGHDRRLVPGVRNGSGIGTGAGERERPRCGGKEGKPLAGRKEEEMADRMRWKREYGQLGLTALCAAGLFGLLFGMLNLYPVGDGSILMTDLYSQYVPLLYRFYDVVTGEKGPFADLFLSGGANLYADTACELVNPVNYLLLLLHAALM